MTEFLPPSWVRTHRPALALCGIIGGYVAFNSAALRMLYNSHDNEYFMSFIVGGFAFQGLSFGIWLAIGPGPFVMRLPLVIVGVCIVATALGLVSTSIQRMDRF